MRSGRRAVRIRRVGGPERAPVLPVVPPVLPATVLYFFVSSVRVVQFASPTRIAEIFWAGWGTTISAIYLVDDEETVREAVSNLLAADGVPCKTFSSSDEFLSASQPSIRGCAVIDFRMPKMDGMELYRELRKRGFTLPIIFLTAHGDVPLAVSAMREGAADFIQKPFKSEDFLERIHAALKRDVQQGSLYARLDRLTPREREVANLMAKGLSTKAIAAQLGSSAHTVRNQRTSIFRKMDVQSVVELVRIMNNPDATPTESS